MGFDDQTEAVSPLPAPRVELEARTNEPGVHLVVVTSRALDAEATRAENALRTRFWHPRDRRWSENDFESLEHARALFEKESGWVLRQEQTLDAPLAVEWIFEAHRKDFDVASTEQILEDIAPELLPDGEREGGGQAR
jgi:hypothetical protein